ncbi:MAG: hypothetical protein LBM66_06425 [Bifidobacteriaceae bacterium]|jgi:hypothetical protein|nr:hypothetical protein [Bifidobacteriaceae bacterium]
MLDDALAGRPRALTGRSQDEAAAPLEADRDRPDGLAHESRIAPLIAAARAEDQADVGRGVEAHEFVSRLHRELAARHTQVEAGERFTGLQSDRRAALVTPLAGPPRFVPTKQFLRAMSETPPVDYQAMLDEADAAFDDDGDRLG